MHIYEEEKNANFTWTFTVKARVCNLLGVRIMVFNATFNNISVISCNLLTWSDPYTHTMLASNIFTGQIILLVIIKEK
jgi:hypothetical protein